MENETYGMRDMWTSLYIIVISTCSLSGPWHTIQIHVLPNNRAEEQTRSDT